MIRRKKHRHGGIGRVARIAAALVCALSVFQLAGCVLQKLNTEMKRQVNAEVDQFIAGDEMTSDQRLVARAVGAMNGGAYFEAEALLDSALQINPANRVAMLNLGAVYEATQRRDMAIHVYKQLADPIARPVAGTAIADNDVARLAASRLAVLHAGSMSNSMRQAVLKKSAPAGAQSRNEAPTPTSTSKAANAARSAPSKAADKAVLVTLSSHKSEAEAKAGWDALIAKHGAVLDKRTPIIAPIESGDGESGAYRLATGPFASAREAATFCDKLLARRVYCLIAG